VTTPARKETVPFMPTVAKNYYYPGMQQGMTRYWYLSSCKDAGKPAGLLPATVAADLNRYTTQV